MDKSQLYKKLWEAAVTAWGPDASIPMADLDDYLRLALGLTSTTSIRDKKLTLRAMGYIDYPDGRSGRAGKKVLIRGEPRVPGGDGKSDVFKAFNELGVPS